MMATMIRARPKRMGATDNQSLMGLPAPRAPVGPGRDEHPLIMSLARDDREGTSRWEKPSVGAQLVSTPPTNREIEQAFRAIQAEGGVHVLTVLSPFQAFEMLSRARSGDRVAQAQLEAIEHMLELVQRNSPATPLCLLCGADFGRDRPPMLFSFLQAYRDRPPAISGTAVGSPDMARGVGFPASAKQVLQAKERWRCDHHIHHRSADEPGYRAPGD